MHIKLSSNQDISLPPKCWNLAFLVKLLFVFVLDLVSTLCVCLHVCIYTTCLPGASEDQKRILYCLELGLQMVVSHLLLVLLLVIFLLL